VSARSDERAGWRAEANAGGEELVSGMRTSDEKSHQDRSRHLSAKKLGSTPLMVDCTALIPY